MTKAEVLFGQVPKTHNCAQCVAAGAEHEELVAELAGCGGGRAPEGRCGALHAALRLTPPEFHHALTADFIAAARSEYCRELKQEWQTPCSECVAIAAGLAEKYREELQPKRS